MTFTDFYQAYPRKVARGAAEKAFDKLKPDDDLIQKMILAIQAQARYRAEAKKTGDFLPDWPHPATWLNQQRWDDEIPSHAELKERRERDKCATHNCQADALKDHLYCVECDQLQHHTKWREPLLRQRFVELGVQRGANWKDPCLARIYRMNPVIAKLLKRYS